MRYGHRSPVQADVCWDGVVAIVTVTGELDITTVTGLARRLLAIGAEHPERLVLDLSGLVLVDAAGAGALDDVHTLLQTECPVILRQPQLAAPEIFSVASLGQS